ncbi:permease component of ABC-type sugar transporter [Sphaerochaeta pleomorpha str. Grapes]|uniref:Permease component of ABC-type sugar transporter n=1 Tax=Sphaerochaeta pleomorpha (strain ATCC BAA-1885 / DSM 22778 / Grapes) TaxID=158190 RepID=G8QWB2_SPHPG|nr:sugar ABC transporter permease [Sphaerochaeta pleomorpha]AEV29410.1 permease component of ABC-type sugar transporter [Sphaerochaeta pleomorpha str. Grapes]
MTQLKKKQLNRVLVFCGFTIPAFLAILLSVEIPFLMSVISSFTKWNGLDRVQTFIGLENYKELFLDDSDMWKSMWFTLRLTLCSVVVINLVALFLAVLLDSDIKGKNTLRAAFYVPNIISLIIIGYIWRFIFSAGFESFFQKTGWSVFMSSWLGDTHLVFFSVLLVSVWNALGFYLVVYIAGLQSVPHDLIEASMIDGASRPLRFFRITLPMIMPSITVCVFYSLSNGLKAFDVILSLTNGGPGNATTTVALDIYRTAFVINRFGYGTAKSVILFLMILLLSILQVRSFKQKEVEV